MVNCSENGIPLASYQARQLIIVSCLLAVSASFYAGKSVSSNLYVDGRMVGDVRLGVYGAGDAAIFHTFPYLGHGFYSPCYPFANCIVFHQYQSLVRRQQRAQRQQRNQSAGQPVFGGIPAFAQQQTQKSFRTNENEILPEIRGYSQIRSEYKGVGEYLPEFLQKRTSTIEK